MTGLRVDEGDGLAVQADHAAVGQQQPADGLEGCRLPRAVGAQQRQRLAGLDLEADIEEHLEVAVRHVEVPNLEHWHLRVGLRQALGLILLLEQLINGQGDVTPHIAAAVHDEGTADDRGHRSDDEHGRAVGVRVGERPDEQTAEETAHQEDRDRKQGERLGPPS